MFCIKGTIYWEQRKVNEIIEDYIEKTTVQNQYTVLTSSQQKGIVYQEEYFSDRQVTTNANIGYYVLPRGYFTYRSRSDTNVFVFNRNDIIDKGIISYYYPVFLNKNSDSNFLLRRLNNGVERQITMAAEGTGQHVLSHSKFKNIDIFVPYLDEQKCIGKYFESIDKLITLHQSKYFRHILKAITSCTLYWEQRKWIDVVDISKDMVDPQNGKYDNLPHISPGNIESFTGQLYDNVKCVKDENLISGKFKFSSGDIIYGKINPQLGKYLYATFSGLTSADAYVLNAKNDVIQKYLYTIIQTGNFFEYSVSVSMRSGMPKINRDELNAYSFFAPVTDEQLKIGNCILKYDHLITLHQRKLEKLKIIKKSMLENL